MNSSKSCHSNEINIPEDLRALPQWVFWRLIDGRKVLFDRRTNRPAKSNDPSTWATLQQAQSALLRHGGAGLGFVFSADDPFCGIDVDACRDPETGELSNWAKPIISKLASYTEVSPSGTGVKIICRAKLPSPKGKNRKLPQYPDIGGKSAGLEAYDHGRWFALTGDVLPGCETIEDRQDAVNELFAEFFAERKPDAVNRAPANPHHPRDKAFVLERARRYMRHMDPAISGERGHDTTFRAACELVLGFDLTPAEALPLLQEWNVTCQPPWDDRDLKRKLSEADKQDGARGYRLNARQLGDDPAVNLMGIMGNNPFEGEPPAEPERKPLVPLGEDDPDTGKPVLSPKRTLPTAERIVRDWYTHDGHRTLHAFGESFYRWHEGRYREVEDSGIRHRLQPFLHNALRYVTKKDGSLELVSFEANAGTVRGAVDALRDFCHIPITMPVPSFLDGEDHPPIAELLPCKSSILHIPTRRLLPATPTFFNVNACDFDPDFTAPLATRWIEFLREVFSGDEEQIKMLQEWCAYVLTGDTSLQKMLLMIGPKRSGKGTIARLLTALVGAGNVCAPTTSSLAGQFGLQSLLARSLAIVSDARFHGEGISTVIERLLCISGEDTITVDRKHMTSVSLRLPTRFMFLTNEAPRLTDASGALVGRFIVLKMEKSFYGCEDPTLEGQLRAELPGILNWALEGWDRLHARGRFIQPEAGRELIEDLQDLGSPVRAFLKTACQWMPSEPTARTYMDDLYQAWRLWCADDGRATPSTRQTFGRDLAAVLPGLKRSKDTSGSPFYRGLVLLPSWREELNRERAIAAMR